MKRSRILHIVSSNYTIHTEISADVGSRRISPSLEMTQLIELTRFFIGTPASNRQSVSAFIAVDIDYDIKINSLKIYTEPSSDVTWAVICSNERGFNDVKTMYSETVLKKLS